MMAARRPEAKKSLLAGRSPAQPPAEASSETPAVVAPSSTKRKITFMVPEPLAARLRAAYRHTAHLEGHRSFSEFIAAIAEREVERLENLYNEGTSFPPGRIPRGRPLQ